MPSHFRRRRRRAGIGDDRVRARPDELRLRHPEVRAEVPPRTLGQGDDHVRPAVEQAQRPIGEPRLAVRVVPAADGGARHLAQHDQRTARPRQQPRREQHQHVGGRLGPDQHPRPPLHQRAAQPGERGPPVAARHRHDCDPRIDERPQRAVGNEGQKFDRPLAARRKGVGEQHHVALRAPAGERADEEGDRSGSPVRACGAVASRGAADVVHGGVGSGRPRTRSVSLGPGRRGRTRRAETSLTTSATGALGFAATAA